MTAESAFRASFNVAAFAVMLVLLFSLPAASILGAAAAWIVGIILAYAVQR